MSNDDIVITYDYDPDQSMVEIYINLTLVATWACEDDPEEALESFIKIWDLGVAYGSGNDELFQKQLE